MIKLLLTEAELTALTQLMDAGVKAIGLGSVSAAAVLLKKIQDANQEAQVNAKQGKQGPVAVGAETGKPAEAA